MPNYKIPGELTKLFLFFSVISFLGWLIESAYSSIKEKRIVNSGFLYGPFVPYMVLVLY